MLIFGNRYPVTKRVLFQERHNAKCTRKQFTNSKRFRKSKKHDHFRKSENMFLHHVVSIFLLFLNFMTYVSGLLPPPPPYRKAI